MINEQTLIKLFDLYCSDTGFPERRLSWRIFESSSKINQLKSGRGITVAKFNQALCWFALNWPTDLEWPADIVRPTKEQVLEASKDETAA